jgi:exodeoxyribonuclease VII small subunit
MKTDSSNFEAAFKRLEEILERMNAQDITLDESVALFEEANQLVIFCHKKLSQAENRIEVLLKTRAQELSIGSDGKPQTTPFSV